MSAPEGAPPRGDGAYLGESRAGAPSRRALLTLLFRERCRVASIARALLSGKRLRARQQLAALIGLDHRLALSPTLCPALAEDGREFDGFVVIGTEHLVVGAAERIRQALAANPDLQAIYGDGVVELSPGGPYQPRLPPAFDADLLLAVDYIGSLAVRRGALPTRPVTATEAALRIVEAHGPGAIGHLPGILSRRAAGATVNHEQAVADRLTAVRGHLDRTGAAETMAMPQPDGVIRIIHPLAETPLVSVIVPTRDRLDLLRPCLDSLRTRTAWPSLEVIVGDNDSHEPESVAFLQALEREGRGGVVPYPGPFNFAAMNNAAAKQARGRLLVFMNNDVEAFRADWLVAMARHALRPEVGAVGAKLLDDAGRIQHGGIVLGTGGLVTHGHRHFPGDSPGYLSLLRTAHRVSAVTAACLMVEADKFAAIGGFDEASFAVDFNDVDLCLRLNAAGYRTILAPEAVLYHREAASRRWTDSARARHEGEVAAFKRRWGPLLAQDPHYHPGFDRALSTHARLSSNALEAGTVRRSP